jgi:hypothetical protein
MREGLRGLMNEYPQIILAVVPGGLQSPCSERTRQIFLIQCAERYWKQRGIRMSLLVEPNITRRYYPHDVERFLLAGRLPIEQVLS